MFKTELIDALQPENLRRVLGSAFSEAGLTTIEALKDDKKVEKAAVAAYERIPFALRLVVRTSVGKQGFVSLVFRIRDQMIRVGHVDFSWLGSDQLKQFFVNLAVPRSRVTDHTDPEPSTKGEEGVFGFLDKGKQ